MIPAPWFLGGMALASVAVAHRLLIGKSLAVSGRFGALVDRVRHGRPETDAMSDEELIRAMQEATAAEFGPSSLDVVDAAPADEPAAAPREPGLSKDIAFLVGLAAGGLLFTLLFGAFKPTLGLRSVGLRAFLHERSSLLPFVLMGGGMMVGFGTRMAGGCTSGHGLCGVSRFQRGSLLATCTFFGVGIAVSWLIEVAS